MKNAETVIDALAELLKQKETENEILRWRIQDLEKSVKAAEEAAATAEAKNAGVLCKKQIEYRGADNENR